MNLNKELFNAIREVGKVEGILGTGLSVPGDAATFIFMIAMARAWEGETEAETDPRLR